MALKTLGAQPVPPPEPPVFTEQSGFTSVLYAAIAAREDREHLRVYASKITDCAREQVFSLIGAPKSTPQMVRTNPQWSVAARFGDAIHELVQKHLIALGYCTEQEVEFRVQSPDGALSGRVDALVTWYDHANDEPRRAILDIKTVGTKDFVKGSDGPKFSKYKAQIDVYGTLLDVPLGIVLLVDRGSGEMREFHFAVDTARGKTLLARATAIKSHAENKRLPRAEMAGTFYCTAFCPFTAQCAAHLTGATPYSPEGVDDNDTSSEDYLLGW